MRLISFLAVVVLLAGCAGAPQNADLRHREASYRQTLGVLGKGATRAQLRRAFPKLQRLSSPREPGEDSMLTGRERFRVDGDFDLDVKFLYAAPYRIAAGATRLSAQAAADVPPSPWQLFGFIREASRGPFVDSPHDEVLSWKLLRSRSH